MLKDKGKTLAAVVSRQNPQTVVVRQNKHENYYLLPNPATQPLVLVESKSPLALATQILRGPPGRDGADGNSFFRDEFIPSAGQIEFILTHQISNFDAVLVFVNGQKQKYSNSYHLSTSGSVVIWTSPYYQLDPEDILEIYYQYL